MIRPAAVAGTWYPGIASALTRDVDAYLSAAAQPPAGTVTAIIAPHAGLMFSGGVSAYAYRATTATEAKSPIVQHMPAAHRREHSLEMQLPFLRRVHPELPIVPVLIGFQHRDTIEALADAIVDAFTGRRALIIASTDLSHYFDARTAATLDGRVRDHVAAFDPEGLLATFETYPEHERGRYVACGGGAAIAVMKAARGLGATEGRVLKYAHSGEINGDYDGVVGYLAAAFGVFSDAD